MYQGPKQVPSGLSIEITIDKPSIVYIAHEDSRSGGFQTTLPNDGWTLVSDQSTIVAGSIPLKYLWSKEVTSIARAAVTLPETTSTLVHYNAETDFTNAYSGAYGASALFDPVAAGWNFVPEPSLQLAVATVLLSLAVLRRRLH